MRWFPVVLQLFMHVAVPVNFPIPLSHGAQHTLFCVHCDESSHSRVIPPPGHP
jgi:hypothetical protein